jgi:hypothetical protein
LYAVLSSSRAEFISDRQERKISFKKCIWREFEMPPFEISGFHGGKYEDDNFLGYSAM